MINYVYSQRTSYNTTIYDIIASGIMFLDLTAFFFLSFMNICFDTIVANPPFWLMFILFMIMGVDLLLELYYNRKITYFFILSALIMTTLILSFAINGVNWVLYISASVFLRFPQVIKFNQLMQAQLRPYYILFKLYTFFKIFYVIAVVGHVLGCLFYLIDDTLITMQYYGPISQNPSLYYQGELLCYSPIYSLDQIDRYLYCMYYIMSLLATVAYGDIIPKNPYENAYVCILLVLSTVSISFIIQQLLIVLSDHSRQMYQILKRIKYLDSMLQKSTSISAHSRLSLIGYLLHTLQHQLFNSPKLQRLTQNLQIRLRSEAIHLKKKTHTLVTQQGKHKISNLNIHQQYSYPTFLVQFLLLQLEQTLYPVRYILSDNDNIHEPSSMFITLKGQLKLGYSAKMLMHKTIKYKNKLLCWREFIMDNKNIHPHFRIQTKGITQVYTICADTMRNIIKGQRYKSARTDQQYSEMLQKYWVARNNQLTQIYYQGCEVYHSTQSMDMIKIQAEQIEEQIDEISTHILRCWACGNRTHFPDRCPNLHYKPNIHTVLRKIQKIDKRVKIQRPKVKSSKLANAQKIGVKQHNYVNKTKKMLTNYINRKSEQLNMLRRVLYGQIPQGFEQYEDYEHFYHSFNVTSYSNINSW